ncbi:hypothetical protein V5O48_003011 [Marasmius crinis-equi]|uniref:HMG box domain-containing protein n=1 Tax=Marasmius crinis-equi TaxID=585013 RepID=A0ABR3FUT4_9AGAR
MPPNRHSDALRRSSRKVPPKNYDEDAFEANEPDACSPRTSESSTDASYSPHPSPYPLEGSSPPSSHDEKDLASPRTSKPRKATEDRIRRPPNAFILFRSDWKQRQTHIERDETKISRMAGIAWRNLPPQEKAYWERKAHEAKIQHKAAYPEYRYAPKSRSKPRVQKKRTSRKDQKVIKRREEVAEKLMRGESLGHGVEPVDSPTSSVSSAFTAPSSSPVEVKAELPRPELSLDSLYPQPARITSPSFPIVGHDLQSPSVAGGDCTADVEFQHPDFVESEETGCDAGPLDTFVRTADIPTICLPAPVIAILAAPKPLPVVEEESPYASPRANSPALPFDRQIDNYFGCKHETYNLDPQQILFTNSNGYQEVSSFSSNNDQYNCSPYAATSPRYELEPSSYHSNANVNYEPNTYTQPETRLFDTDFNDDFLYELAQNNPSYIY